METKEILDLIETNSLDELMKRVPGIDFVDYLNELIEQKNVSKSQIIQKTNLQKNYAYQMMSGVKIPSKDKVIQLILSLQCTSSQANRLLSLSNNGFLYAKNKRDALILYAIEHHLNVMQCNEKLIKFNLPILE